MPYDDMDLDQIWMIVPSHYLNKIWLIISGISYGIHLREISLEMPKKSFLDVILKISQNWILFITWIQLAV